MTISRQVGTLQELYPVFIQDATVSTGLGFPNLTISTFSSYYYRSDMTSTSSVTLVSTGTLGTWSSGQFLQINSTFMRGWYQFCLPNGIFAAGSTCAIHLYGHPSIAPTPVMIEITRFNNQGWVSSQPHNITRAYSDVLVTTAAGIVLAGPVGVSSVTDKAGYSVTSMNVGVNVTSVRNTTAVTTVAGYFPTHLDFELTRNNNSTVAFSSVSWSTQSVSVGSVDVTSFYGSGLVTTAAGRLAVGVVGVSSVTDKAGYSVTSMNVGVNVTSIRGTTAVTTVAGYFPTHFDLELTRNVNSTVAFSSVSWSTQSVSVGSVDVTSFFGSRVATSAAGVLTVDVSTILRSIPVTSVAGIFTVNVSTLYGSNWVTTAAGRVAVDPVGVSSITDKAGYSVTSMNVGVNVTSVRGTTAVTTVAGYFPSHFDLELTRNVNSTVAFSSVSWSTQAVTVGSVDVTSFYGSGLVTTAAGVLAVGRVGVSSMNIGVGVTTLSVPVDVTSFYGSGPITSAAGVLASHVTSMRAVVDAQIADRVFGRNIAGGSDGGRTLTEAVYVLRNRTEIAAGVLTVYGTDDATSSWAANVTTTAGNPISQIDPS